MRQALKDIGKRALGPAAVRYVRAARRGPFRDGAADLANRYLWSYPRDFSTRTQFGALIAGNSRDFIPRYLYLFGTWEPNLTAWMSRRLSPGDVFVDVGANIGYYSLLASRQVGPQGAVVAVEASPSVYADLSANLQRNGAENVRAVNVAASSSTGTLGVYLGTEGNLGQTTTLERTDFEVEARVEAAPLPEILDQSELARARLIKIDVEGAELDVVRGLAPALDAARPDLEVSVEIDPEALERQDQRADEVFEVFAAAGFNAYVLENDYRIGAYAASAVATPPLRLDGPITEMTDIVFSREGAAAL